jgi:DNA repair exonuclease SbcCD nuclease subunit
MIEFCIEKKITQIICLGDWFDNRKYISLKVLSSMISEVQWFDRLILLIGNHDSIYKNTNEVNTPEMLFRDQEDMIVIHEPTEMDLGLFIPWINKENVSKCLKAIEKSTSQFCFGHFEINNFEMVRGIKCRNSLSGNIFKKFKRVFSGHFHLKAKKGNIQYLGSLFQLNWNDYDDEKGFYIFDPGKPKVKFIPNSRDIYDKVYINDDSELTEDLSAYEGRILKIYINRKLSKKEDILLTKIMDAAISFEIIDNTIILEQIEDIEIKEEDILEVLQEFANANADSIDQELKDEAIELIKTVHHKVIMGDA